MKTHPNARTCPHCRLLIVSKVIEDGYSWWKVARDFRVSRDTVYYWIQRYRKEGIAGLEDKPSTPHRMPGSKTQPGKELHDAVMKLLHTPPGDHGYNRTTWRMPDIKTVLDQQGTEASLLKIRIQIKSAGLRWRKARVALTSNDPDYRAKLDAIKNVLAKLSPKEAFFSIDELGPVSVKTRGGRSLQMPGQVRTVPQWQKPRGVFIVTAALDLATNQMTFFFSEHKNTDEMIRLIAQLRKDYKGYHKLYLSWDAASWHSSARLLEHVSVLNGRASPDGPPMLEILPLPSSAQFLNVIESVFSGMARAILHNSDYATVEDAQAAVTRYFRDRNDAFRKDPKRAGRSIWGKERVLSSFSETNNCKNPDWMRRRRMRPADAGRLS